MRWFGVLALLGVVFVISGLAYAGAGEGNWASYVHYSKAQTLLTEERGTVKNGLDQRYY